MLIDVCKAYDYLDRGSCTENLRGHSLGPKLQRLLQRYWDGQKMVSKTGKYYGSLFSTGIGVTQGEPVYLTIFNIVVDVVVRVALQEVCGPQEAHHGFRWVTGEHNICFYEDEGRIAGRNSIWLQTALTAMVRMFKRVSLRKNTRKTKEMICTLGFIWGQKIVGAYKQRDTGEITTFR